MAEAQPTVEYRDIEGHPGYRVGTDGSVWSCRRTGPVGPNGPKFGVWRRLRPGRLRAYGRLHVCLSDRVSRYVHRLVLEAFVGPCPPGMEALHGDGDPGNNALGNLRWGTSAENAADSRRHGTITRGERTGTAKLTAEAVLAIKAEYAAGGVTHDQLARKYGVNTSTITRAIGGRRWAHLSAAPG